MADRLAPLLPGDPAIDRLIRLIHLAGPVITPSPQPPGVLFGERGAHGFEHGERDKVLGCDELQPVSCRSTSRRMRRSIAGSTWSNGANRSAIGHQPSAGCPVHGLLTADG